MKHLLLLISCCGVLHAQQFSNVARGNVVDSQSKGLAAVKMTFKSLDDSRKFEKVIETDEKGYFTLAGLQPVEIEVLCEKEGFRPQIFRYKQPLGEKKFDLQMLTIDEAIAEAKAKGELPEADPKDLAKEDYNLAVPLFKAEKWAEALELVKTSLEKDPELDHSMKLGAHCGFKLQQWDLALGYAESYLKLHPEDLNIVKLAAAAAENAGNKAALAHHAETIKKVEGVTPEGLYNEAVTLLNAGKDEQAKPILLELLKLKEDHADAYRRLGEIAVRTGDFDTAIPNLKKFLKLAPNHKDRKEVEDLLLTLVE
jgi:tetratricopeptide (TPR) repeat protein